MLYREAGQFKASYAADQAIFPILQDRIGAIAILAVAFLVVPFAANEYWLRTILTPFLIYALASIGLNLLTGYAGLVSLGTGGFMAVGAFTAYNLAIRIPGLNVVVVFLLAGLVAACVGILFGLPSLRIKGFYLAVATLAAQFFLEWLFSHVPWFTNDSSSGVISSPEIVMFGFRFSGPVSRYLLTLTIVAVLALLAKNLVRGNIGRSWMAIRDMDIAAEIIGIRPLRTKLLAFAVSSFYIGIAGALWAFVYLGSVDPSAFDLDRSFQVLFMVIIGGLGSILGSFLGAAFILLLPILLSNLPELFGVHIGTAAGTNLEFVVFGTLIVFFLIVEPHGLARLWQIGKEKLRLWPFPH
ncbi:MAG TPA: branched-chain amino acid ABC transporter permease [Candidatus Cybelea sp.]|nr:branched-chain amino acid ABC transporter permease [Candidatus Cybelea sp.]